MVWNDGTHTDGGAIRLGSEEGLNAGAVTVSVRFNEASFRYPYEKWKIPPEENHVDRWVVRSGDGTTHALDMDRSITIRSGTCG